MPFSVLWNNSIYKLINVKFFADFGYLKLKYEICVCNLQGLNLSKEYFDERTLKGPNELSQRLNTDLSRPSLTVLLTPFRRKRDNGQSVHVGGSVFYVVSGAAINGCVTFNSLFKL